MKALLLLFAYMLYMQKCIKNKRKNKSQQYDDLLVIFDCLKQNDGTKQ